MKRLLTCLCIAALLGSSLARAEDVLNCRAEGERALEVLSQFPLPDVTQELLAKWKGLLDSPSPEVCRDATAQLAMLAAEWTGTHNCSEKVLAPILDGVKEAGVQLPEHALLTLDDLRALGQSILPSASQCGDLAKLVELLVTAYANPLAPSWGVVDEGRLNGRPAKKAASKKAAVKKCLARMKRGAGR